MPPPSFAKSLPYRPSILLLHRPTRLRLHNLHASVTKATQIPLAVDPDLWQVLELCGDDELSGIYMELTGPSPFSPLVKSVVAEKSDFQNIDCSRGEVMGKIESRFRFLAANSLEVLKGTRPSYRDTLTHMRHRFDVRCSANLDTVDLEAEIFLHLLHNYQSFVLNNPEKDGANVAATFIEGDGMSFPTKRIKSSLVHRITTPLRLGKDEVLSTITKLGGAVTFSAMSDAVITRMGANVIARKLNYQAALSLLCTKGVQSIRGRAAVQAAERGLTLSAARFGAVRSALALLSPMMWTWLGVDLAMKSIGTDYARVVKTVFALAQVRLLRTHGFTMPKSVASTKT